MNLSSSSFVLVVGLVLSSVACGGNTLDGGSNASGMHAGPQESTADFSSERVAAAKAACDAPHGPVDPAPKFDDVSPRIVGAWYLCSEPNAFNLTKSLEFDADGTLYILVPDAAGGLNRAQGLDHQKTWSKNNDVNAWIEPGPIFPEFESAPRRMRITVATSGFVNWYVPL